MERESPDTQRQISRAQEQSQRSRISQVHCSANEHRRLLNANTDLATVGRVLGVNIRASPAITTPRAGARTSGQTYVIWRALGGIRVAHPILLLKLLGAYSVTRPRGIPRNGRSHISGWGWLAIGRTIGWVIAWITTRHGTTRYSTTRGPQGSSR